MKRGLPLLLILILFITACSNKQSGLGTDTPSRDIPDEDIIYSLDVTKIGDLDVNRRQTYLMLRFHSHEHPMGGGYTLVKGSKEGILIKSASDDHGMIPISEYRTKHYITDDKIEQIVYIYNIMSKYLSIESIYRSIEDDFLGVEIEKRYYRYSPDKKVESNHFQVRELENGWWALQ